MEQYNHTQYMELLATKNKAIAHQKKHKAFAIANTIQLFEGVSEAFSSIYFPCLVVINDSATRLIDQSSDNLLKEPYFQFAVLCQASINDTQSQEAAGKKAESICDAILSRMFRDQRAKQNGLDYLQRDGIRFETIGPVADGAYGRMVTFTIIKPANIIFNSNEWTDGGTT